MTDHDDDLKPLAIEGKLPLKAVGIENLKEDNPKHMPPHRYLHPWFARRPTPAARIAILASILPKGVSSNEILKLMQIGPKVGIDGDIADYVESKKAQEDERSGTLGEHYGYDRPFTSTPTSDEISELHETLRDFWDGELPKVLDPTAGGGVIPFEALRYGLPAEANELNAVPSLILKTLLDYPVSVGHLRKELQKWAAEIDSVASDSLSEYYPDNGERGTPSHYASTYAITCPNCAARVPVTPKWWLHRKSSNKGIAVRPSYEHGDLELELVELPDDVTKEEFNPQDGPRARGGDLECPNCDIVTESSDIKEMFKQGDYEYQILGVKYTKEGGNAFYRAPTTEDKNALEKAKARINDDMGLFSLLTEDVPPTGEKTSEPVGYGITEWRDFFNPRQLVTHYEYWQAFEDVKEEILETYSDKKAESIVTILALTAGKMIDYNSRLSPYKVSKGYPENAFAGKNFTLQWIYVDNNLSSGNRSYEDMTSRIMNSYEDIAGYFDEVDPTPAKITSRDAADLEQENESIDSVVVDPPYYSSIMYAELSDIFYVWQKRYVSDIHPEFFQSDLTDKDSEAVANPSRFEDIAGRSSSKKELAKGHYENKMSDIFSEIYRVLKPGGSMTVMFTHKETDAWDTLTMSLIRSGFVITSTHPITSEMPDRMDTQGSGSADSTLLLTGRKPHEERDPENAVPTLWSDVEADTRAAAKEAARDLLESGVSLTKTDVIISAFGPTLRVFADAYPVVDDQDEKVPPRKALETAREAVTQILVDEYLEGMDVDNLDDVTEWYILCWLVHEAETFAYDDGLQLGHGIGVDIDEIKRSTKTWRKSRGDISLRGHSGRVQNINEKPEDRSSRLPVDPDDLSFPRSLDAVHAAMHVYDKRGETETIEWLRERNFDSDSQFKSTLKALLQVLPHNHEDWELARDLAVGRTSDVLDLDFSPNVFAEGGDETSQSTLGEH
jgi:putative DNA methylase